jgi:tetratricopeptide (TPR) repeat protein
MGFRICGLVACLMVCLPAWAGRESGKLEEHLRQLQRSADLALSRGDSSAAIAAVQEGLKVRPTWKEGLWTLGWTLFQVRQYEAARGVFVRLVRLDQSKGASWLLLGLCEFHARDYGMALEDLQRGRALGIPLSLGITSQVRYDTAVALLLGQRYERALQFFEEAAHENEHTNEILLAWGLAALRMPVEPDRARDVFGAEQLDVLHSVGEAMFHAATHDYKEASKIYADLFRRHPAVPKLHHAYGFLLIRLGDLVAAESEFHLELGVAPDSVLARMGLAYTALERGEPSEAIGFAREAVRLEPESVSAHLLLARALLRVDQAGDAVPLLEVARDLEPGNMQVHFLLARAYGSIKRDADAAHERSEFVRLKQMDDALKLPGRQTPNRAEERE